MVDASFAQEQPPLDVLAGAVTQRILGVGDVIQRANSMAAAIAAATMLALLLWRRGFRIAAPFTVGVLAIAPLYLSIAAYARPYALPLALMLGWIVGAELWLERRYPWAAVLVTVCALLLPLSRVFEPPAFLVLASFTIFWYRRRYETWGQGIWLPIGGAVVALVAVEIPVYLALRERLTSYSGESSASWSEQWDRIVDDTLPRLGNVFEIGWLPLVMVGLVVLLPDARAILGRLWWFWPLAGTAVSFALAFHVRTEPTQPFYERYGFFWWPPFAICLGVLAQAVGDRWNVRSVINWVAVSGLAVVVAVLATAMVEDFRSDEHVDRRALGAEIESRLPPTTTVVYDTITRTLGSYRPGFAGEGRYTTPQRLMLKAERIIGFPHLVVDDVEYAFATDGGKLAVDGWLAIPATDDLTLYVPEDARRGRLDLAKDLLAFGDRLQPRRGAVLRLGAASLYFDEGDRNAGCAEVRRLVDDDGSLVASIRRSLLGTSMSIALESCPGGNPVAE
jgi:hypothetical protein